MINASLGSAAFEVKGNVADALSIDWSRFRGTGVGAGYDVAELSMLSTELSVSHL